MRRLWMTCGKAIYWLGWPAFWIYLFRSRRTRVLVVCGDEILAVRGWLGNGDWALPGGGLHRKEAPARGAVRELKEETGIEVAATELQLLFNDEHIKAHGFRFRIDAYVLELQHKPILTRQKSEISHIEWVQWRTLLQQKNSTDIQKVLAAFYQG